MCSSKPKISLVIPVYNSEKFLRRTLNSVLNQTFKDIEVIIINDGSTDNSINIIKEYIEKHNNFYLIDQENKGQGAARNVGVKRSKGEYITFLDSDDFLSCTFLETLYKNAIENNADISCCNYYLYYEKSHKKLYMPFTAKSGVYSSEIALKKLILDTTFHYFLWNKLYKRSLFVNNNIEFYNMYFEDVATCPKLFYYANKVAFTSKALYYYTCHDNSILSMIDAPKVNDFIKSLGIIRNFLESKNVYHKYRSTFKLYAYRFKLQIYYCILMEHFDKSSFSDIRFNIKNACTAINLFVSDNYIPTDDPPNLPQYVMTPRKKKKIRTLLK